MSNRKFIDTLQIASIALTSILIGQSAQALNHTSGKATIYSDAYCGKKTATGERFKQPGMSAASNTLPLGSKVLLKNKKTGKKVVVKVNDRMSKHASAAVDLSKGAAQKLGIKGSGQVDATVISSGK